MSAITVIERLNFSCTITQSTNILTQGDCFGNKLTHSITYQWLPTSLKFPPLCAMASYYHPLHQWRYDISMVSMVLAIHISIVPPVPYQQNTISTTNALFITVTLHSANWGSKPSKNACRIHTAWLHTNRIYSKCEEQRFSESWSCFLNWNIHFWTYSWANPSHSLQQGAKVYSNYVSLHLKSMYELLS